MTTTLLLLSLMQAPAPVEGGITGYAGRYVGRNLSCPGYRYERETGPWIALDVSWYEQGLAECGDWFSVTFSSGERWLARALDSGYLDYRIWPDSVPVWDSENLPMVADVPGYYFWRNGRVTATGTIFNVSARGRWQRELRRFVTSPGGIRETY